MKLFRLTLTAFLLGVASLCAAQELKPSPSPASADSAAKPSEAPKGEFELAGEELKKRGELVLTVSGTDDKGALESKITEGVVTGKAIQLVQPDYPAIARASRASGTVEVMLIIDKEGKVMAAKAVRGHPLLFGAALKAARACRFTPTTLHGKPIYVLGKIVYQFVAQ